MKFGRRATLHDGTSTGPSRLVGRSTTCGRNARPALTHQQRSDYEREKRRAVDEGTRLARRTTTWDDRRIEPLVLSATQNDALATYCEYLIPYVIYVKSSGRDDLPHERDDSVHVGCLSTPVANGRRRSLHKVDKVRRARAPLSHRLLFMGVGSIFRDICGIAPSSLPMRLPP